MYFDCTWCWRLRVRWGAAHLTIQSMLHKTLPVGAGMCKQTNMLRSGSHPPHPSLTPAAAQETLVSGASLSVSHHGYATALAAAAAPDARLRQLHSQGQLTDDQLARRLSLGDEAQPRSRVRGVSYCRTGAPAGRPWRLRLQQQEAYFTTRQDAELAALAILLLPLEQQLQTERLLEGQAAGGEGQHQLHRQLGPLEAAQLLVSLHVAGSAGSGADEPPAPPTLDAAAEPGQWTPEACQAEEGLAGSASRQRRFCLTLEGTLLLRLGDHYRRFDALAAVSPGVLRPARMPMEHLLERLQPQQAVQLLHRLSDSLGQPYFPGLAAGPQEAAGLAARPGP